MGTQLTFRPVAAFFQLLFLFLFAFFAKYDTTADGSNPRNSERGINGTKPGDNPIHSYYPMFQDIHVMIFIGFGFLMMFLKRYGFSAVGLNMMIASFCIQWSMLIEGFLYFMQGHGGKFPISIQSLINADFAAATVLITFGAVLGKTSPVQLLIIAFIEVIMYKFNEYIGQEFLEATDTGRSMYVHVFGAYFGLVLARIIDTEDKTKNPERAASIYHSDIFSVLGTIFLWMYWPSFNAALVEGDRQHRAVINTYLALVACVVTTFTVQNVICKDKKFDMMHVQHATLGGGVAVGTCADLMLQPAGAITIGIVAGMLSSLGLQYLTPKLAEMKVHDTCGVNNLHGIPGLLAAFIGIIMASSASESQYGYSLYQIYPGRAPVNGSELMQIQTHIPHLAAGEGRSAGSQAGYQMAALICTLLFACASALLAGVTVKAWWWEAPQTVFDDREWWNVPDDFILVTTDVPFSPTTDISPDEDNAGYTLMEEDQPSYGTTEHNGLQK